MLANPVFADLYEEAGKASLRATTDGALDFFSKVFWFTLEFGVLHEDGELKAYGAGLLSSYGEIEVFRDAEIRPWDIVRMGTLDYDITHYQPVLFAAGSFDRMVDDLTAFFAAYDDDAHARWIGEG
jgi:phenylalanine-4-hydroxylase